MKKYLIVANWKMNPPTLNKARELFDDLAAQIHSVNLRKTSRLEIVVCPPFLYLDELKRSHSSRFFLGAQDCFWEEQGAYTGEISPPMLKKIGCTHVIIGHSERRKYLKETDAMLNKKVHACAGAGLGVVFCVGEKKGEQIQRVLPWQLERGLKKFPPAKIRLLTVAYEPVWAIGSNNPCKPENAYVAKMIIRKILTRMFNRSFAKELRIIYGGSVESVNAAAYITEAQMQGFIVGHESLDVKEFSGIVRNTVTALSSRLR